MINPNTFDYEVRFWKSPEQIKAVKYAQYWNDENHEATKEWWILDNNWEKMEHYLSSSGLKMELLSTLATLQTHFHRGLEGTGADLASGNLWTIPLLLESGNIEKIYAVEYSQHRLLKLGPAVLNHYSVPATKVVLCLGSFYELQVPNESLDFVVLSQAFHHADSPSLLLNEIRRVLKPNGRVIITGEHIVVPIELKKGFKHALKYVCTYLAPSSIQKMVTERSFLLRPSPMPPDPLLGDHFYHDYEYDEMFSDAGFSVRQLKYPSIGKQSFLLTISGHQPQKDTL